MSRPFLRMIFMVAIATFVTSCSSKLTPEKVSQIKTGMTQEQVADILGKPAEMHSQSTMGLSESTYVYHKDKSEVKVVFINGKVSALQSHLQ